VLILRSLLLAAAIAPAALPASLAISTYLRDGFTPSAIASDTQGNILLAGTAVIDPIAQTTAAVVVKVNPTATGYLYVTYLDSAASDTVSGMAVDSAGNTYVTGWTTNPFFVTVGSTALGTLPDPNHARSFVTKVSPEGAVLFSVLIGGSAVSNASGIALTPQGQILVSGTAGSSGFPTTPRAYSVSDSTNQWFLMELNATADQVVFSATGIGGSSLALDPEGNIYMAGSSTGTDYPTTRGAYQTTFVQGYICYSLCQIQFPGVLQHVTKVDPAATTLLYSTGLNSLTGNAGNTITTGLAVDAAGNAYVTGTLFEADYPLSVPAASYLTAYLTKLDPSGSAALYSIPAGGGGVQLDSSGAVYVGGYFNTTNVLAGPRTGGPFVAPAVFSWVPQPCLPNSPTAIAAAYVMKIDAASGDTLDGQWIDGSAPAASGIALAEGRVWITGFTPGPDVPITPGALTSAHLGPGFTPGGYLSAVDFSAGVDSGPRIACVLDAANLTHAGAVASFQLLSIFGANLGPAPGVAAPDGADTSLAGVSITFDGQPAQLLYVSANQINVAVTPPIVTSGPLPGSIAMQVNVNGVTLDRQFPFTSTNLNIFANLSADASCAGFLPLAANADGTLNSCTNPAKSGTTISFFVEGAGGLGPPPTPGQELSDMAAYVGACGAGVTRAPAINNYVFRVDVALPPASLPCANGYSPVSSTGMELNYPVFLYYRGEPIGPYVVPVPSGSPIFNFSPGQAMPMLIWVTE